MSYLRTGDILLAHADKNDDFVDKVIETFTHSPYVHAAIIIKDPWWTSPPLKGLYVLQSSGGPNSYSDVLNGQNCGVTLNKFDDFMNGRSRVDYRQLYISEERVDIQNDPVLSKKFEYAFIQSHGKPYDRNPRRWCWTGLSSFFRCSCCLKMCNPPHTNDFWCSALVSYIYEECGLLLKQTDYSDKTPEYLANVVQSWAVSSSW